MDRFMMDEWIMLFAHMECHAQGFYLGVSDGMELAYRRCHDK